MLVAIDSPCMSKNNYTCKVGRPHICSMEVVGDDGWKFGEIQETRDIKLVVPVITVVLDD